MGISRGLAQSMTPDSIHSKWKMAYRQCEKFTKSTQGGQGTTLANEEGDDEKGVEYGIGNVLGQKKKSDKVYKKSGHPYRIRLRLGNRVALDYELSYGNDGLRLRRKYP
ncbi:MAG: hypothetical protein HYZ16_10390 [Bacteroidetes bacterium]|nr:hypothetical protein [Bacteroidota bacterium]